MEESTHWGQMRCSTFREVGGRGLKSTENEYKLTKIKTAVNLSQIQDFTMKVVRDFEERWAENGHYSLLKDAI